MQLIRKGGFRERANRYTRFEDSENKQQRLASHQQYPSKNQSNHTDSKPPTTGSDINTQHIPQQPE